MCCVCVTILAIITICGLASIKFCNLLVSCANVFQGNIHYPDGMHYENKDAMAFYKKLITQLYQEPVNSKFTDITETILGSMTSSDQESGEEEAEEEVAEDETATGEQGAVEVIIME